MESLHTYNACFQPFYFFQAKLVVAVNNVFAIFFRKLTELYLFSLFFFLMTYDLFYLQTRN